MNIRAVIIICLFFKFCFAASGIWLGGQASPAPTGTIITFAGVVCPSGYLEANGASISRNGYNVLFSVIGTIYGNGDGSTTFNLPDLRGYFVRGYDHGRGVDSGRTIGSSQSDDFKSHSHSLNDPGHFHGLIEGPYYGGGNYIAAGANGAYGVNAYTERAYTNISVNTNGGSETRPKNIAMLYCIKN